MAKVLVIEDNDMLNMSYKMILSHHGHEVQTAFNGQEGLAVAASMQPDIILLDYFMPIMDGRQFLIGFGAKDRSEPKIILLTNMDEPDKIDEAKQLGADTYVLKASLAPDELARAVRAFL